MEIHKKVADASESGTASNGELITWYLATLRNNARKSNTARKLTPLTLVETDRNLIQEIVMRSQGGYEQRSSEILKMLQDSNKLSRVAPIILSIIGAIGTLFMLALIFF